MGRYSAPSPGFQHSVLQRHPCCGAGRCLLFGDGRAGKCAYSTPSRDRTTPASHSDGSSTSSTSAIQAPTTTRLRHLAHSPRRNLRPQKNPLASLPLSWPPPTLGPTISRISEQKERRHHTKPGRSASRHPGKSPDPPATNHLPPASCLPLPSPHWPELNRTPKRRSGQGGVRNIPCQALKTTRPQVTPPRVPPHMVRGARDWLTRVFANGGGPGVAGV